MKQYTTAAEAIADMHERGFTSDFQLFGSNLLWVQQKTYIRMGLFAVTEYHQFWNPAAEDMDLVLIGIIAPNYDVQGILFIDYAIYPGGCPSLIARKMDELNRRISFRGYIENESLWIN